MEIWQELKVDVEKGARKLVDEYGNRLFVAALMLCESDQDAEDLTFRTLERAICKISQYNPNYSLFTWMYAIMRNLRKMDLRKKHCDILAVGSSEDLIEIVPESFVQTVEKSSNEDLEAAIRSLSTPLREVIILRYFHDKSIEEIAKALSLPEGTIKSRLHNARAMLNKILLNKRGGSHGS